jgi:hypothetical protein
MPPLENCVKSLVMTSSTAAVKIRLLLPLAAASIGAVGVSGSAVKTNERSMLIACQRK